MIKMTSRHSVLIAAVFAVASTALAAGEGGVRLKAKVGVGATYDSNVFLAPEKAKSAIAGQPVGSLGVTMKGKRSMFGAGYEIAPQIFSAYQKANNAVHQTGVMTLQYEFMPDGLVGLDDMFRVTSDPATSELTKRAPRNQNDAAFMLDVPLGSKLYFGVRASDTIHHYRLAGLAMLLDRNELLAGGRLGMRPTPKTKVYGLFKASKVDFKSASSYNDSSGSHIGLGLEGELSSRIKGLVEANTVARKYSRTVSAEPTAEGYAQQESNEHTTGGFTVSLAWEGPGAWTVALSGGRGYQESVFNRYYVSTSGNVSITKGLGKKMKATLIAGYGSDAYPNARTVALLDGSLSKQLRRKDSNLTAGFTLAYSFMEKQTMKLGWMMRSRSSNFDVYKYSDNTVTASADYSF